jgi:hypothetical protein
MTELAIVGGFDSLVDDETLARLADPRIPGEGAAFLLLAHGERLGPAIPTPHGSGVASVRAVRPLLARPFAPVWPRALAYACSDAGRVGVCRVHA